MNNLEEYARKKEKELSKIKNKRKKNKEGNNFNSRDRDNQERDYARILYSSSFRRLQGKMQLFIPYTSRFNRNRLTHSLEVAQIAGSIARKLKLKDTLTVQACSLAHDIGHPPFGHSGEETLNNISQSGVRFEGNAQTFRILHHLEEKHFDFNGLNLTYRTLLGTVKYFQTHAQNGHKFLYDKDYDFVKKIVDKHKLTLKTIDAEIMDIADEIAYAAHDLEDAFYFKSFTIDELLYEFKINKKYKDAYELFRSIVKKSKKFASKAKTYKTSEEYLILFKKQIILISLTLSTISHKIKNRKVVLENKNYP